jgi:hypothetical protein
MWPRPPPGGHHYCTLAGLPTNRNAERKINVPDNTGGWDPRILSRLSQYSD